MQIEITSDNITVSAANLPELKEKLEYFMEYYKSMLITINPQNYEDKWEYTDHVKAYGKMMKMLEQ